MATYNVSTWDEFVNAFTATTGTADNPDVIEIMTDLDVNSNPPTRAVQAPVSKIINGNFHTIWNLSPGSIISGSLIKIGGSSAMDMEWNKVNFNNMAFLESYPVFGRQYTANSTTFNDCTFVAKVAHSLFVSATLNRCAVTMTGSNYQNPMSGVTANYCWIHYEHKRTIDNANQEFSGLNTCYLEGKIITTLTSANYAFPFCYDPNSCVFNVEIADPLKCTVAAGSNNIPVSVYNTDKVANYTGTRTELVGVTDSQLKDAEYLAGVGFDIVVT